MASGAEYLSSNSLTTFPFDETSGVPDMVCRLFCDAVVHVGYKDDGNASVQGISVNGHRVQFTLVADGEIEHFDFFVSDGPYHVVRSSGSGFSCFVIDADNVRDSLDFSDPKSYRLSPSCLDRNAPSVLSFSVFNSTPDGSLILEKDGISDEVTFIPGTNMELSASESGVTFSASPGAGAGTVPCNCFDKDESQSSPPQLAPSVSGDVMIEGDGCLQVNTDNVGTIEISGRCSACCPTEKYVEMANHLADVNNVLAPVYEKIRSTEKTYTSNVKKFNAAISSALPDEFGASLVAGGPVMRKPSWVNPLIRGKFGHAFTSTVVTNASQSKTTVSIYPPEVSGMKRIYMAVSLSCELDKDGKPTKREIPVTEAMSTFEMIPGASLSSVALFSDSTLSTKPKPGRHTATQLISFSWTGLEERGSSFVAVNKKVDRELSVDFELLELTIK